MVSFNMDSENHRYLITEKAKIIFSKKKKEKVTLHNFFLVKYF